MLGSYFSEYGKALEAKIILDEHDNSRRFGFVTFQSSVDVQNILARGRFSMLGKQIIVGPAVRKKLVSSKR